MSDTTKRRLLLAAEIALSIAILFLLLVVWLPAIVGARGSSR